MAKKPLKQKSKKTPDSSVNNYLNRIETNINANQSKLSMVLGGLIVLVVGILIFNYYSKSQPSLGPAQQAQQDSEEDVSADKLPGKYTVKEGDTLFTVAEKYYKDGSKFTMIADTNNISDIDTITTGQVLEIPKSEQEEVTKEPVQSPEASVSPTQEVSTDINPQADLGTGGGDTTIWGSKIEGSSYTIQEGDWLSTVAARAYNDPQAYQKIADANNIQDPDYIVPGMVLKIPR